MKGAFLGPEYTGSRIEKTLRRFDAQGPALRELR